MPWSPKQVHVAEAVAHGWKPKGTAAGFTRGFANQVIKEGTVGLLTSREENSLPDAHFAAVYSVISKKNGRTSSTKVRKLPIHDAAHVRNALARFDQTDLPPAVKARAKARIDAAAKKFGVEVS